MTLKSNYFYGQEAEQFSFCQLPKMLIYSPNYRTLSSDSKLLYCLMLDRMKLSMKNGWLDQSNRVFIYFTLEEAMSLLVFGKDKGVKVFKELEEIGLIERRKQGNGKPAMIYVKSFLQPDDPGTEPPSDSQPDGVQTAEQPDSERLHNTKSAFYAAKSQTYPSNVKSQTSGKRQSFVLENSSLDCEKAAGNKNNKNKTYLNKTEHSLPSVSRAQTPDVANSKRPCVGIEAKVQLAEFVFLTQGEHKSLIAQFGQADTDWLVNLLNSYKGSTGKRYESDYWAIRGWCAKRLEERNARQTMRYTHTAKAPSPDPNYCPGDADQRAREDMEQLRRLMERDKRERRFLSSAQQKNV